MRPRRRQWVALVRSFILILLVLPAACRISHFPPCRLRNLGACNVVLQGMLGLRGPGSALTLRGRMDEYSWGSRFIRFLFISLVLCY